MGIALKRYKVTATKDVGYEAFILAKNEDEAWTLAMKVKIWSGHEWTMVTIGR